jgi:hypothetical protein
VLDSADEKLEELFVFETRGKILQLRIVEIKHSLVINVVKVFPDFGLWRLTLDVRRGMATSGIGKFRSLNLF